MFFFLLVDGNPTMKGGKLELLKDTFNHIIDFLPEDSYLMIGKFGSGCEWLTSTPQLCGTSQKPVFRSLFSKVQHPPETRSETTLVSLLQTAYTVDYPEVDFPRSVIVLSNGNFSNQKQIEQVVCDLVATDSKHSVRISCLGIGSGASDSFLRTIAGKGHGIMQVVTSSSQIKERVEFFTKHLRAKCITNISLAYDPEVISFTLPLYKPKDRLLKSQPFEIYFFVNPANRKPKTALKLSYFDEEDKTDKTITITADLSGSTSDEKSDLHKIVMNRLLADKYSLQKSGLGDKLKEIVGTEAWSLTLAIDHQIFTPETAYLAIAHDLPEDFDQLGGDLDTLEVQKGETIGEKPQVKQVFVKQVIANDYLKKTNHAPEKMTLQQLTDSKATPPSLSWMKSRFAQEKSSKAYSTGGSSKTGSGAAREKENSIRSRAKASDVVSMHSRDKTDPSLVSVDFTSIWQQAASDSDEDEEEKNFDEDDIPRRSRVNSETTVTIPAPAASISPSQKGSYGAIPHSSVIDNSQAGASGGSERNIGSNLKPKEEVQLKVQEVETTESSPTRPELKATGSQESKVFKLQPIQVKDMVPTLLAHQDKSGKWCFTVELLRLFSISEEKLTMFSKANNLPFDVIVTILAMHALDLSKQTLPDVVKAKQQAAKALAGLLKQRAQFYNKFLQLILKELTPVFV